MRIRSATILATLPLALSLALFAPAGAQAAPPFDHFHEEVTDSGSFDDCGFTIEFDFTGSFHTTLREVPDSGGQAFFLRENVKFQNVLTNPATGAWFLIRGTSLFKEMTARHVEGDIWEFTAQEVGQPFTVEDSDGNLVLRDRGRITLRALFDTLGDSQPGGDLIEEEITSVSGPHPGLEVDFCEIATDLIG
jgi:hypothetical protein